jgi:hypothetical protein
MCGIRTNSASHLTFISALHSMLDHPNLVHCYGASTRSPGYFIVTELAKGGSFRDFLRNENIEWDFDLLVVRVLGIWRDIRFTFLVLGYSYSHGRTNTISAFIGHYAQVRGTIGPPCALNLHPLSPSKFFYFPFCSLFLLEIWKRPIFLWARLWWKSNYVTLASHVFCNEEEIWRNQEREHHRYYLHSS